MDLHDIFADLKHHYMTGIFAVIVSAVFTALLYGVLKLFGLEEKMTKPKRRTFIIALGVFITLTLWVFFLEISKLNAELTAIRNAAVAKENRGLQAGVLNVYKTSLVMITNTPPNAETVTAQGINSNPQARSIETGADITFVLRVSNSGEPTTAWDFAAYVILPGVDQQKIYAMIPSAVITTNQVLPTIAGPLITTKENFLLDALSTKPMQTGAAGNYWLNVHINGLKDIPIGTHFVITFHDVQNRETRIDYAWVPGQ